MGGFIGIGTALANILQGQRRGQAIEDQYKSQLGLEQQRARLEEQRLNLETQTAQSQLQQQQEFDKNKQEFLKDLDTDPGLAGLKPMRHLLAGMGKEGISAVVDNYFKNVQTQTNRKTAGDAYRQMGASDPAHKDVWDNAAAMVEAGASPGLVTAMLKAKGIGNDPAMEAYRAAATANMRANASMAETYNKVMNKFIPGVMGSGSGAMPPPPPSLAAPVAPPGASGAPEAIDPGSTP